MNPRTRLLQVYLTLLMVFTLLLTLRLFRRTDVAGNDLLLGYSPSRIALLIPVLILTLVFSWLTIRAWRDRNWLDGFGARIGEYLERQNLYLAIVLFGSAVIILGAWLYQIGSMILDPYFQGYFSKIAPFLLWGVAAAAITILFVRFYHFGTDMSIFQSQRAIFKASGATLILLILIGILMAMTGLGLKPDLVGWGDPGTPVLPAQVLLLAALCVIALVVVEITRERWAIRLSSRVKKSVDVLIFVIVWLSTIWMWQAQPLTPAYFAPQPVAPNFEYYPYSDAANYEVSAQELLIGKGFGHEVRRPIYSLFLALAQFVSGVGYAKILLWQVPMLALIPPLLYLLGKGLHSRLAGGMIAGLALFHEVNAIRLSSLVNVSHAKLLMSDLPTALGVIAFTVVLVYWWKTPQRRRVYPLFAGGILALTMLVRIQVVLLLPGVLLPMLINFRDRKRQFVVASGLLLIGMGCVLIPWLWRGQQASGNLSFAEATQESQIGLIGVRYNLDPDLALGAPLPNESSNQYSQRMLANATEFIRTHPFKVVEFITAHLFHNQLSTLLTLPPDYGSGVEVPYLETNFARTWEQCCSVSAYIQDLPYWKGWDGQIPVDALIGLIFNLFFISVGLGSAWSRNRSMGILPLWLSLCYALGNSLVRNSGWRFNLPVDWVGLFYYGIGLVQTIRWGWMLFANRRLSSRLDSGTQKFQPSPDSFPWIQTALFGTLFFLVSAAIPAIEAATPARYPESWPDQISADQRLKRELQQVGITVPLSDIATQNAMELVYGRAVYPRYFGAKQGIPGNAWFAYVPREYPRLGFYLLGSQSWNVVLPLENSPIHFPHAVDVIVLGCSQGEFLEAQMVILPGDANLILRRSPQTDCGCGEGE